MLRPLNPEWGLVTHYLIGLTLEDEEAPVFGVPDVFAVDATTQRQWQTKCEGILKQPFAGRYRRLVEDTLERLRIAQMLRERDRIWQFPDPVGFRDVISP